MVETPRIIPTILEEIDREEDCGDDDDVSVWCIVVAAGDGTRFGVQTRKQYALLRDRRVLDWSLAAARLAADGVVLVVASELVNEGEPLADVVVAGGDTRSESVRNGLTKVPLDADVIVVHDAARPLASNALFESVIAAVNDNALNGNADGAVPAIPVVDTIKRIVDERVVETVDRKNLVAVQTPQAFRGDALRRAHEKSANATDDAALVEAMGGTIVVVSGELTNLKITTAQDLVIANLATGAPEKPAR